MRLPAELAVLLYTPGSRYDAIRLTIASLRAQTARERLEIVLLAPNSERLLVDEEAMRDFSRFHVVSVGEIQSRAQAMAEGVRKASAPLVAFGGNHSCPAPDWAARLIEAHQGPWAAVAPSERNANPATAISWAHFLIGHGHWIDPVDAGVTHFVPMTSAAFKRSVLLEYGPQLARMLERDGGLSEDLRAKRHRLYLEPAARIFHFNISRLSSFVRFRVHVGRAFAASRARKERWGAIRRLAYAIGWPLIPFVQLRTTLGWARRCNRSYGLFPRVLPALTLGLMLHALGEAIGYTLGMGDARQKILSFESDLNAHMTKRDRELRAEGLVSAERP